MSEIRRRLEGIGVSQHTNVFRDNNMDMDVLGQVDDHMSKDIGISNGAHRLRIPISIAQPGPAVTMRDAA